MAITAPFNGLTYNFHVIQNYSNLVAPPYDVISEEQQEAYYRADPRNVIRLILGKKKKGDTDWDNRYTRAAAFFKRWESEGTLIGIDQPSIYVTSLEYDTEDGETRRTRWGVILLVRIEDPDSGIILPHEKTFSAHKDDRLKLIRSCEAQFSQIFGLYEDPDNRVINHCKKALDFSPQISFDFNDGTRHRMWILQRPSLFKRIADVLSEKSIFIADGHHRYETSRNFRNIMRTKYGRRSSNRSYEYVMMYLSGMSDEGLSILPSHRLIKHVSDFQIQPFFEVIKKWFDITEVPFSSTTSSMISTDLKERLDQAGRHSTSIIFCLNGINRFYLLSLKSGSREEMGEDLNPSLKKLDVLVLSRFILQKGLGFTKDDLDNDGVFHYQSSMKKAISQVQSGEYQMAFLLNPTRIEHVKEIASNRLVMPRKSTYFYPKILTGMVFNKIDPHEIIQVP